MSESPPKPDEPTDSEPAVSQPEPVEVHPADFPEMTEATNTATGSPTTELPLGRFLDVTLQASVELGRAAMPMGDVLKLGAGAIVELDRDVTEPVDIMVQGVRLARGEVVVVEGAYAVRITEIESGQLGQMGAKPEP